MTHEDIKGALSAYFDGQLAREEAEEISAHVETCPECRAALKRLALLSSEVKEVLSDRAPAAIAERVLKRTRAAEKPMLRASTAAVAVCVAVIIVLMAGLAFKHVMPGLWANIQGKIGGAAESLSATEGGK